MAWLLERGKNDDCDMMDDSSCSLADQSLSAASEHYQEVLGHQTDMKLRRTYTVRSYDKKPSELMTISKSDLFRMKIEHYKEFDDLFDGTVSLLHKIINIKVYAMSTCSEMFADHQNK